MVGFSHPRFEVNLVNGNRLFEPMAFGAGIHPFRVAPCVFLKIADDGGGLRWHFRAEAERIGFQLPVAQETRTDEILVGVAVFRLGEENLPDPRVPAAHGVTAGIPVVEIAGDRNIFGVGRPEREAHALNTVDCYGVGPECMPSLIERSFAVQIKIVFRNDGAEPVGVVDYGDTAMPTLDLESIGARARWQLNGVEALRVQLLHGESLALDQNPCRFGLWQESADYPLPFGLVFIGCVWPEDAESVTVVPSNDCVYFGRRDENFDHMALSELHLHLEGTVDRETVMMLDPCVKQETVDAVWSFTDFAGFLECFKFIAQRLRGPRDYALITRRLMDRLAQQGITYAEVTLGAGVVLWRGFDFGAVWRAIREAQREAEKSCPVEVWWNLDAIRQFGPDHAMDVAKLAAKHADDGVISFGIGGDEVHGPALELRNAYRYAKDAGLRVTAHAGETDGPQSIRDALEIGAERIGHGIRAVDDPDLMRRLREERIPLEVCITSNVKTGAVASLDAHPVRRLFDAGVPITLNTDDPGVFETDLAREFGLARDVFRFSNAEIADIAAAADEFRFAPKRLH